MFTDSTVGAKCKSTKSKGPQDIHSLFGKLKKKYSENKFSDDEEDGLLFGSRRRKDLTQKIKSTKSADQKKREVVILLLLYICLERTFIFCLVGRRIGQSR